MSKKKYKSSSHVSLSVKLEDGSSVHVCFTPQTGGGSVFYTDDPRLQRGLERHARYGRLFRLVEEAPRLNGGAAAPRTARAKQRVNNLRHPDVAATEAAGAEPAATEKKVVKVSCIDDAKEWLVKQYGLSRTKLRSKKAILEAAEGRGIEFQGI